MAVFNSNVLAGASGQTSGAAAGFQIDRSLRFNDDDSAYLSRDFSTGNRKTWTWSGWVKRSTLGFKVLFGHYNTSLSPNYGGYIGFVSDKLVAVSHNTFDIRTTGLFRDVSAWYHIIVAVDTTLSTQADRVKLYVNGARVTDLSSTSYPSQNADTEINKNVEHNVGKMTATGYHFDGYMAEINFIDGQALAASDFGEYDSNSVWQPKRFAGTYGWFDNSQTWSTVASITTGAAYSGRGLDKLFNGTVNNTDPPATAFFESNGSAITVTFSSAITATSSIKMWIASYTGYSTGELYVNGSNFDVSNVVANNTAPVLVDLGVTSLTSFGVRGNQNIRFSGLVVDGKILIDSGVSVADNSFRLNFSDNSSNASLGTDSSGNGTTLPCVEFDGTGDFLDLGTSNDFAFGTGDYTIEFYVRHTSLTGQQTYFSDANGNTPGLYFYKNSGNQISMYYSGTIATGTTTLEANRWYHVAASRVSGTTRLFLDGSLEGSGSDTTDLTATRYSIADSYDTSSGELVGQVSNFRLLKGTGLYNAAFTKPSTPLTNVTNTKVLCCQSSSSTTTAAVAPNTIVVGGNPVAATVQDTAWTVNNLSIGSFYFPATLTTDNGSFYSGQGPEKGFDGDSSTFCSAATSGNAGGYMDINVGAWGMTGALEVLANSAVHYSADGATATALGSSWTNVGNAQSITTLRLTRPGQSNTPGFYSMRIAGVELVEDAAGTDSLIDTPTNYTAGSGNNGGNYPTWNPLRNSTSTFSNGNLQITTAASGYLLDSVTQFTPPGTGKWYWEFVTTALTGTDYTMVGMLPSDSSYQQGNGNIPHEVGGISVYIGHNGDVNADSGAATAGTDTATFGVNDILGWAFDAENGTVKCYKNGVAQGTQFTNVRTDVGWAFCLTDYDHTNASTHVINFGQRPFAYTPPTGHVSLCTTNLPDPTIADGSTAFDAITYTGNGSAQTISGLGFSPDLVWSKIRSSTGKHRLTDIVRGTANALRSDGTNAEFTDTNVTAFNSDGFDIGANGNASGYTYVGWTWDAGTSTVSNTDGSITSNVRANPSAGFSIVTATQGSGDSTWGHGLNAKPDWIVLKARNQSYGWFVSHSGLDNQSTKFLQLHNANGVTTNANWFASTEPTGSVITTKAGGMWNSSDNFVAYCWTAVEGYSAFGSFTGNGDTGGNGPFVYTGFRPRWVMWKSSSNSNEHWHMLDTARDPGNLSEETLYANLTNAESTFDNGGIDILSNGFKVKGDNAGVNGNGYTYIYAAFAEHPFKTSRAR